MADQPGTLCSCHCPTCQQCPGTDLAQEHQAINRLLATLDERRRRLFLGLLASHQGHGGVVALARITGVSRTTIRRGLLEIQRADPGPPGRVRRPGGGRKPVEKKTPA